MSGKAILVVGSRGTGKTTYVKNMLKGVHPKARLVYDVNNEYKDLYPHELLTFEEFTELTTKAKGAFIVFEEATIFLSYKGSNSEVRDVLVRARHTQNTIVFVFHSLRAIPRYLFDLCDFVVLHKTNDSLSLVEDRFESEGLTEVFKEVKGAAWLTNSDGKRYSPHRIFDIYGITEEPEEVKKIATKKR